MEEAIYGIVRCEGTHIYPKGTSPKGMIRMQGKPPDDGREYIALEDGTWAPKTELISVLLEQAYAIAKSLNDGVIAKYSTGETADWTDMVREAQAGNSSFFADIVKDTGVTEAQYMQRILDNAKTFRAFKNAVLNAREKHLVAIQALTGDETEPYDIMAHWPKDLN